MFLCKRSYGIYFIEFFDEKQFKTRRISTGALNKKLATQFLNEMEIKKFIPSIDKSIDWKKNIKIKTTIIRIFPVELFIYHEPGVSINEFKIG